MCITLVCVPYHFEQSVTEGKHNVSVTMLLQICFYKANKKLGTVRCEQKKIHLLETIFLFYYQPPFLT